MSRIGKRTRRKTQMKSRRVRRVRRGSKIRKRTKTRKRVKRGGSPTRTNMISTATSMVGQKSGDYLTSLTDISNLGDWFGTATGKKERDEKFMGIASDLEDKLERRKVSKLRREEKRKNKTGERKDKMKEIKDKAEDKVEEIKDKEEDKMKEIKDTEEDKVDDKVEEGTSSQVLSQNFEQTERAIAVLTNIAEALQTREFKTQFQSAFPRDLDTEIEQEIQSRGFDVNPGVIKNIFSYFTKGQVDFLLPVNEGIRDETIHCIVTIKGKKQFKFGDSSIDIIDNGESLASRPTTEVVKSENNAYLVLAECCPHNSGVVKKVRQVEPATLDGLKRITDQLANQASYF